MGKLTHFEKTAYHEAGHAVVSYFLGRTFKYVTVIPDKDKQTLGHLRTWRLPKWLQPDIELTPRIKDKIETEIMVKLAGHIAEKKFSKRNNHIGSSDDTNNATSLALYIGGDGKGTTLFLKWIWYCAESQVNIRWENIITVAQTLLKKKKLTEKEVGEIIMAKHNIKNIYN